MSIVEWADIINDLLPDTLWHITIENDGVDSRILTLECDAKTDINKIKETLRSNNYEIIN